MFQRYMKTSALALIALWIGLAAPAAADDWQPTGFLAGPRWSHTATLLPSGKVLVIGGAGLDVVSNLPSAEIYDPSTGTWQTTAPMTTLRREHTATLLPSGKVLVVGGWNSGVTVTTSELYDPATDTWKLTESFPNESRISHTATLLRSGKVLIVGGRHFGVVASAELYDPHDQSWTSVSSLEGAREHHTATLLPSGKVLVAGGLGSAVLSSVEIYDPGPGTWRKIDSPLGTPRMQHTATLLPTGQVLVVGGFQGDLGTLLAGAEIYDPSLEAWHSAGALATARRLHTSTLLASGQVLIAGGRNFDPQQSTEIYDPVSGIWQAAASLNTGRDRHTATLLPSGDLLVAGGEGAAPSAEVYHSSAGTWQSTGFPATVRSSHTATLLPSGEVLVAGGAGSDPSTELYDPDTGTWQNTGSLGMPRRQFTATLLPTGQVLVAGGFQQSTLSRLAGAEIYDPGTGIWQDTGSLATARNAHTATLLPSGKVLVAGGYNEGELASAEVYDPGSGVWSVTGSMVYQRTDHTATLLPSGEVLVVAGSIGTNGGEVASAEIYDPSSRTWQSAGSLDIPRTYHSATLLPSGQVLIAGGYSNSSNTAMADVEIFDPQTGAWHIADSLPSPRFLHTATLLPSGKVLVSGGAGPDGYAVATAEVYDPSTDSWQSTGDLGTARLLHTATLLPSGQVLVAGLWAELYDPEIFDPTRQPIIHTTSPQLIYGQPFQITGQLRGDSEASGGNTSSSAVNYPLVQIRSLASAQSTWLVPDLLANFSDDPLTLTFSDLPASLDFGYHLLTVFTAGVASKSVDVEIGCSVAITEQPMDQTVLLGASATFSVKAQGGRHFQWQKDGIDISGATAATYTTPPVTAAEVGVAYRVRVGSGCAQETSDSATLQVAENEAPEVEVVSPAGGEYWLLSKDGEPHTEVVTWAMTDNVRICQAEVALLFSTDGGQSWLEAAAGGGLPATFGGPGACPHPGVETSSLTYTLPIDPPSGEVGSLYKIRVRAIDQAGNVGVGESPLPFFMVQSNSNSVKTLILAHLPRMQSSIMGITAGETAALATALADLANHPRVQGLVVDLGSVASLAALYEAWDVDPGNPAKANDVLFAAGGLHEYLRQQLLPIYTGVESLVIVGDDRIVPMARLQDLTWLSEATYTDPLSGGLTADGTTVGAALAANRYLSDDLLGISNEIDLPLSPDVIDGGGFLQSLAIGRLVETPDEIITTVATFISQDGILDLEQLDPQDGHKVLITGYDFLIDSSQKVGERWRTAFGVSPGGELAPVDDVLVGPTWGVGTVAERRALLFEHLAGNGGDPYGVINLNGHATHFEEGVPGNGGVGDIQGLSAAEIYGPHACGSAPGVDLGGAVVYAVGCHGGLPVAGSCISDADHSLDLPQTMMARGVVAYVANTGYGWGLHHGIGLSERLVEILTEEMIATDTVEIGHAVRRAKQRYFLEEPSFSAYDEKTVLQWALFGLPMYAVRSGLGSPSPSIATASEPETQRLGEVRVEQQGILSGSPGQAIGATTTASLPPYLTQLSVHFDLSAPGVYTKYGAEGEVIASSDPGCSDPQGCYYTLNGLVERGSSTPDLPIQPYLIYQSGLSGTSQHGALWLGGVYEEEEGWIPVFAELMSNGGDFSDHGSTPQLVRPKLRPGHIATGDEGSFCQPTDLEPSSLIVVAGEMLNDGGSSAYSRQRRYSEIDLEILYFNDQGAGANCDRLEPALAPAPFAEAYHEVEGSLISWAVAASDDGGVWRVIVVYDVGPDAQGQGRWQPLELTDDGSGVWRGSEIFAEASQVTYLIQAVDRRGNVAWVDFVAADLPASGVAPNLPQPFFVSLDPAQADLTIELADSPDPVTIGGLLSYTIAVENLGPDTATSLEVTAPLPPQADVVLAGGDGWTCTATAAVTCTRGSLAVGLAAPLSIIVIPQASGTLTQTVSVSAVESDPDPSSNTAVTQTFVISGADLSVSKSDGGAMAVPGQPLVYTIAATNDGPESVVGARVIDDFPAEIIAVMWTCVATPGAACTAQGEGDIDDLVTLPSGGTVIYTAVGMVSPAAVGPIENTATIAAPADSGDPNTSNNLSSVSTAVGVAEIFSDGFESGDAQGWSSSAPTSGNH